MAGQCQGGHESVQNNERRGAESKCVAHGDKGWPITTWRRPVGEKCVAHEDKGWPITTWRRTMNEKLRRYHV